MMKMDISKNIRNPLGVIALFITFIYAIASAFFGFALDKLEPIERIIIISFIVSFPFTILVIFYKLVTTHHGKLYSPGDFKSDDSFLKLFNNLSVTEIEEKYNQEYDKVSSWPQFEEISLPPEIPQQKMEKKNAKSSRLSFDKIKAIEEGAIRYFEDFYKIKINRNVKLDNTNITFDGLGFYNEMPILLEVKYLNRLLFPTLTFREAIYRAIVSKKIIEEKHNQKYFVKFALFFILVGDFDSNQFSEIVNKYKSEYVSESLEINILTYNSNSLKLS